MALIELTHLNKIYQTDELEAPTVALSDVTCSIEKGEFVSIVGPSGSGKSTLLQILGLLDRPSSGTYKFLGRSVEDYDDDQQAHIRNTSMGFIFQSFNLLARTSVLENVKLPLAYSDMPVKDWDRHASEQITAVGLDHRVHHEPTQLSGGERQRVAIARALVNDPEIIFADEPTGNLDSKAGLAVLETLEGLHKKGHTIVLITHDSNLAKRAKRIIFIRDGAIEWDGPAPTFDKEHHV